MAGFNAIDLEHGRIARGSGTSQSKKLMRSIKEFYSGKRDWVSTKYARDYAHFPAHPFDRRYTPDGARAVESHSWMECVAPQSTHLVCANWVAQ